MGRSGRQGDPGSSIFLLSLEDDLMRLFGSDRIASTMKNLGLEEGEAIENRLITKIINNAQQRVEEAHSSMRKRILEYDDVMNKQREIIYKLREDTIKGENLRDKVLEMIETAVEENLYKYCPEEFSQDNWDLETFVGWLLSSFPIDLSYEEIPENQEEFFQLLMERIKDAYDKREEEYTEETMRRIERILILHNLDDAWKEHLYEMDLLREGIGLRGYGGQDPLIEYKKEAFELFSDLVARIEDDVAENIFRLQVEKTITLEEESEREAEKYVLTRSASVPEEEPRRGRRVEPSETNEPGRNDPCPCGSGKKYKKCCLKKKVK
jgi:preprotein translocase subunit SecA